MPEYILTKWTENQQDGFELHFKHTKVYITPQHNFLSY